VLVYNSVFIEQELEVSGHIESSTGDSFYQTHTVNGSLDSIVSYNIEFMSGEGLLIRADKWTNVGQLGFDIADIDGEVRLTYMDESMFPPTFIGEFYNQTRMTATEGNFAVFEIDFQDYCGVEQPVPDLSDGSEGSGLQEETTDVINTEIEN